MLSFTQSDIFAYQNKGNAMVRRFAEVIKNLNDETIINSVLSMDFENLGKNYREPVIQKALSAIADGTIIFYYTDDPLKRLPDMIKYVKINHKGVPKVVVDVSTLITINPDYITAQQNDEGDNFSGPKYRISLPLLHDIIIPIYISLKLLNPTDRLPAEAMKHMANLWADMIGQTMNRIGLFAGNSDRREAFRYYAIRFFLTYYVDAPAPLIESISDAAIKSNKNKFLLAMEQAIATNNIDLYSNLTAFCTAMFNSEVTNIRGVNAAFEKTLTFAYFVQKFCSMYTVNGLTALYSPDYFFFTVFNAYKGTGLVYDHAFAEFASAKSTSLMKLIQSLYKEL